MVSANPAGPGVAHCDGCGERPRPRAPVNYWLWIYEESQLPLTTAARGDLPGAGGGGGAGVSTVLLFFFFLEGLLFPGACSAGRIIYGFVSARLILEPFQRILPFLRAAFLESCVPRTGSSSQVGRCRGPRQLWPGGPPQDPDLACPGIKSSVRGAVTGLSGSLAPAGSG